MTDSQENEIAVAEESCFKPQQKKQKSIFLFIKASIASQIASWIDMGMSQILFAIVGLPAFMSKAIGATCGGVINCAINYKWTFQAKDCSKRSVAVKYAMVWIGSLGLNSGGTALLTGVLRRWPMLEGLGVTADSCFFVSQLIVSLVVSICWNFQLQRYFVYRNIDYRSLFRKKK